MVNTHCAGSSCESTYCGGGGLCLPAAVRSPADPAIDTGVVFLTEATEQRFDLFRVGEAAAERFPGKFQASLEVLGHGDTGTKVAELPALNSIVTPGKQG